MNEASLNQIAAADPNRSTWLTANAGSGKTRVLTDRVARLLLAGTAPERILCLTYTKAAATEMQNRLLRRLGQWAMLPEPQLRAELAELGEAEGPGSGPDLAEARRLFTTQQQSFVRLRRGTPGLIPPPIDDIEAFWTLPEKAMVAQSLACSVVGDADDVRQGIADFVARHRPDELMLTANIFDHDARRHSFALAAEAMSA